MKQFLLAGASAALILSSSFAKADFYEAVYTVGEYGSTVPITEFAIDGPAPWLYIDVTAPAGVGFEWVGARWFVDSLSAHQLQMEPLVAFTDKEWLQPSETQWNAIKRLGDWRIQTYIGAIDLILIYGVGVGQYVETPGPVATFSVVPSVPAPVPLPASLPFLAAGATLLGARLRRRR